MQNPRFYGADPYEIAVIHGGPGAAGEMAPVARTLCSTYRGILEPLQTAGTLEEQVEELCRLLTKHAVLPVTLIGHSWGAWLSYITAARFPSVVRKLILVGSGPFEERYVPDMETTRLGRLTQDEGSEYRLIVAKMAQLATAETEALLHRLGALASKADSFDPVDAGSGAQEIIPAPGRIFQAVWAEAAELRRSGGLLELGRRIQCPVVALHGNYDPHPSKGIAEPLSAILSDFRMRTIPACGHIPWKERKGAAEFFRLLGEELRPPPQLLRENRP